jgi:hypothetical protein
MVCREIRAPNEIYITYFFLTRYLFRHTATPSKTFALESDSIWLNDLRSLQKWFQPPNLSARRIPPVYASANLWYIPRYQSQFTLHMCRNPYEIVLYEGSGGVTAFSTSFVRSLLGRCLAWLMICKRVVRVACIASIDYKDFFFDRS